MNKYEITELGFAGAFYLEAKTAVDAFGDFMAMFPEAPAANIKVKLVEELGA